MRPLPSPLAQLSSRYNIVVYSEPRLRSVNHPSAPCPRWLYWQQPTLRSPNLPDAAARISRSIPFPFPVSTILPPSLPPFYPSNLSLPPLSLSLSLSLPLSPSLSLSHSHARSRALCSAGGFDDRRIIDHGSRMTDNDGR